MTTECDALREEIRRLREQLLEARRTPAIPEETIRAVWRHGHQEGFNDPRSSRFAWEQCADEVGRIFAEALKRG